MNIIRYNPWEEMSAIQRQLDNIFAEIQSPELRIPAVEIQETEDALQVKLELPGVSSEDIEIEATQNSVKVVAERKSKTETQENGKVHSEFYYGKFQRVIPLKAHIKNTEVTAKYKDGILHLTLPKSDREKNKVVKVNLV